MYYPSPNYQFCPCDAEVTRPLDAMNYPNAQVKDTLQRRAHITPCANMPSHSDIPRRLECTSALARKSLGLVGLRADFWTGLTIRVQLCMNRHGFRPSSLAQQRRQQRNVLRSLFQQAMFRDMERHLRPERRELFVYTS